MTEHYIESKRIHVQIDYDLVEKAENLGHFDEEDFVEFLKAETAIASLEVQTGDRQTSEENYTHFTCETKCPKLVWGLIEDYMKVNPIMLESCIVVIVKKYNYDKDDYMILYHYDKDKKSATLK